MGSVRRTGLIIMGGISLGAMLVAPSVAATTYSSPNYQVSESYFGSSSAQQTCSSEYCAQASIGDVSAGRSAAPTSSATFGPLTPDEPSLEVVIDGGVSDLGVLTTERTATKTMTVRIRSYLSNGYTLQITGNPPQYQNNTIAPLATQTASLPGTEQFGINLVKNTNPEVGADPVQEPAAGVAFGEVDSFYNLPNQFRYNSGEVVARSTAETARTDYTISFIINVSGKTPAGHFAADYSAVVTPLY